MRVLLHFVGWRLGLARAQTQTTEAERASLARHAAGRRCLVEIGSWHGVTTRRLREAMAPDAVLYGVDPYRAGRLGIGFQRYIAQVEVNQVANGHVRWVRETGESAAQTLGPELAGRLEFIFIDGDHSFEGLRKDWEGWSPLVAPGGVVALHDSRSTPARTIAEAGSVRYTAMVIRCDSRFALIEEVDSLTVFEKTA
jgi:predicted O-methyltransferase YrrM